MRENLESKINKLKEKTSWLKTYNEITKRKTQIYLYIYIYSDI